MTTTRFRFVQLDVPGRLGIDDGRYLLKEGERSEDQTVLVVQTLGAPVQRRRAGRRGRPRPGEPGGEPPEVPLTRLTVVAAESSEIDAAADELRRTTSDPEQAEATIVAALRVVNHALRVHRVATADSYGHEIGREAAVVARIGYGTGDQLAEGRWDEATEVPHPTARKRRAEALRPQERLAAVLAGRERIDVCETLLLRVRADLDQGRAREAALQLRIGLDALLAELPGRAGPDQDEDLAALEQRREPTRQIAEEALEGELAPEQQEEIADTLGIAERVLRRRQILRG